MSTRVSIGLALMRCWRGSSGAEALSLLGGLHLRLLIIGLMQYRLVMSTHEAAHKKLLFQFWLNEFFGVFHSALVGISFFNYRKTHLEHHKNPQSIEEDIDSYIYRPLLEAKPGFRRLSF